MDRPPAQLHIGDSTRHTHPCRTVFPNGPEFKLVRGSIGNGGLYGLLQARHVVRMIEGWMLGETRRAFPRVPLEDPEQLVRPAHRVRCDIPFPASDMGNTLGPRKHDPFTPPRFLRPLLLSS